MIIIVVAVGGYVYTRQAQSVTSAGTAPNTMIEVTGVRNDLLALAKAEGGYFASKGRYASLDELEANGDTRIPTRPNYSYSAQATETGFKIIAVYSGPDSKAPKHIAVDQNMVMTTD